MMVKKQKKGRRLKEAPTSPTAVGAKISNKSSAPMQMMHPQAFPSHYLPRPPSVLRNEPPFQKAFEIALDTAYEGFVFDENICDDERAIQKCLDGGSGDDSSSSSLIIKKASFRVDVTQPFGLGTACAKTYVTRCLVGDMGTTYKYLGLRMFAIHPWPRELQKLKQELTKRTLKHLKELDAKRAKREAPVGTQGRATFDICLINRMTSSNNNNDHLKVDKSTNLKTTVSWHADSSLEHYSTIAVYQTIVGGSSSSSSDWTVACCVAPNAEGPHQQQHCPRQKPPRRAEEADGSVATTANDTTTVTPILAVSLPSNSAYYLLDDFNHHHQHTVLTTASPTTADAGGIRYSCTFRLLRESHNVRYMLERCRRTISNFHKKGTKLHRSEQLLLTELESEWIRQFYIQGKQHRDLLWESCWGEFIGQLLRYWSQLEGRTHQTIQFLQAAAEGQCQHLEQQQQQRPSKMSKAERKVRDRRKKALATMQELAEREQKKSPSDSLYESLAGLLEERAQMRELWAKRETDPVFLTLGQECRPLSVPFNFNVPAVGDAKQLSGERGSSPMPGQPDQLRTCAHDLRAFGRAFISGNATNLPKLLSATKETRDDYMKPLDWTGWHEFDFGLEMQCPWAGAVVHGRKTIETRAYILPPALLGKRIAIIQSPKGKAGISSMGDRIDFATTNARIVGWCTFSSVKKYVSGAEFAKDEKAHLVESSSGYGWKEGTTKMIYGWCVDRFSEASTALPVYKTATRRMRSLYQLHSAEENSTSDKVAKGDKDRQRGKSKKQSESGGKEKKKKKRRF